MRSGADELRIQSRRAKVAELILRGETNQFEICRQLGMEANQRTTISRDIAALNKEWRERTAVDLDEHKARALARLRLIEAAAWKGWERSLLDAETREAFVDGEGNDAHKKAKKTSKGQAGDPRFLKVIADCIAQERDILGLDAPKRQEITGRGGKPIEFIEVGNGGRSDSGSEPEGPDGPAV